MALLGTAAMLLWYDIIPDQVAEHDDWHTRQHFPERVGIPGFIRAQRWVSSSSGPRYLVAYEVSGIDVLSSTPYLERLNHPTPWTSRVMPAFRGMVRGFCKLDAGYGSVLGTTGLTLRYSAATGREDRLREWLHADLLPDVVERKGFTSAFMFRSERQPEMTVEQQIRGRDATVDRVLLVTGYRPELVTALAEKELGAGSLEAHGASPGTISGIYQLACIADAPS